MSNVDDFIQHYGRKGMKWGSRKAGSAGKGNKRKGPSKPQAKDLSDDDLRKAVNRMQMERQYNSLINNSKKRTGAQFVKGIGTTAVKTALTAVATQQVASALKKVTPVK
jgi:hypothetical protein